MNKREERKLTAIDLTGSQEEIDAILAWVKQRPEVEEVSEPTSLDASQALNVGLPDVNPNDVLTFITLIFQAGTASLAFLKALREELKARRSMVAVSESASGKPLGRLEADTSDEKLEKLLSS
jgi:hypothetical protein